MTDIITAMENRHAVRAYDPEKKIPKEITDMLREKIDLLNAESKLHIQLVTDEPKAFDGFMAHYGKFPERLKMPGSRVRNRYRFLHS